MPRYNPTLHGVSCTFSFYLPPFYRPNTVPRGYFMVPAFLSWIMLFCNVKHHKLSHGSDYNFMWWKEFREWVFPVFYLLLPTQQIVTLFGYFSLTLQIYRWVFWAFCGKSRCREERGRNKGLILEECVPERTRIVDAMTKKIMKNYNFRL